MVALVLVSILFYSSSVLPSVGTTEKAYIRAVAYHFAKTNGLDPRLVLAVIQVESSMRPLAKGDQGEVGLMQLHPRFFPDATYNIKENIRVGVKHLKYMKKNCKTKVDFSFVICYNRGWKKVKNYKKNTYYKKILKRYQELK